MSHFNCSQSSLELSMIRRSKTNRLSKTKHEICIIDSKNPTTRWKNWILPLDAPSILHLTQLIKGGCHKISLTKGYFGLWIVILNCLRIEKSLIKLEATFLKQLVVEIMIPRTKLSLYLLCFILTHNNQNINTAYIFSVLNFFFLNYKRKKIKISVF
jgi:hypothetical protein